MDGQTVSSEKGSRCVECGHLHAIIFNGSSAEQTDLLDLNLTSVRVYDCAALISSMFPKLAGCCTKKQNMGFEI